MAGYGKTLLVCKKNLGPLPCYGI